MPCIHGFDEISCPTCKIIKFTVPKEQLKVNNHDLKPESPFFKKDSRLKEALVKELMPNKLSMKPGSIDIISNPTKLNNIPDFKNNMFFERLSEIDVSKSDTFGFSKRISLANPELKLKKEE